MFPVAVGPDRGRACVPALPRNMVAGSVKAMTCTLTSATVTPAPVSHIDFDLLIQLDFTKEKKQRLLVLALPVK